MQETIIIQNIVKQNEKIYLVKEKNKCLFVFGNIQMINVNFTILKSNWANDFFDVTNFMSFLLEMMNKKTLIKTGIKPGKVLKKDLIAN